MGSAEFIAKLDSVLNRSVALKRAMASDRRAILREGIDCEEKLLRAAFSTSTSERTLAVVGWLLPRWPGGNRRLAFFRAEKSLLSHRSPTVRAEAAVGMGLFRVRGASAVLVSALSDESADVRARAIASLGMLGDLSTLPALARLLVGRRESVAMRAGVADALSGFEPAAVGAILIAALSDPSPQVRASAANSLGELRVSAASKRLQSLIDGHERDDVREAARYALRRLRANVG